MSKKTHMGWHDLELYLKEKTTKGQLSSKKDHLLNELKDLKNDLSHYKTDYKVYEIQLKIYKERIEKNKDVLEGLKMIFPEDDILIEVVNDLKLYNL